MTTPIMPLITGLPPIAAVAMAKESAEKNGSIKYDKSMEIALKIPKYKKNAISSKI